MWLADVTVTKIAGYVRIRILMNRWFIRIFGIHSFYATATLLNIWICMQWTEAADGGYGGRIGFCTHACRLKAVANDYRQEYHHGRGIWTLVYVMWLVDIRREDRQFVIADLKLLNSTLIIHETWTWHSHKTGDNIVSRITEL